MSESFVTPWMVDFQAPLSVGFPRQEYWSGLLFPAQGDLPDPEMELESPALAGGFFTTEPPGKPEFQKLLSMSLSKSCPTLCSSIDCSMPCFTALYYLPEFAQTNVHWVSDAIQPSHPLLPSPPFAVDLSQHQGLFQWAGSSHQVAELLKLQPQHHASNEYSG